ncbi:MAG: alpha-amylase family glycosyl hydrolase [Acutalibacteraceae bacterium]|nr:alpha-amylase family glycosyl hydrolase [Acutalibacteraceae bacterium]
MKLGKKTLSVILSMAMVASVAVSSTAVSTSAVDTTKTASSFSWDNASVYFLLTDRFNNGDTSNDHSYNRGLNQDGTVATTMLTDAASFQGGDFKGITQKINEGYFDDLGVNALWISAPYEQAHGYTVATNGTKSYPHYGYHGYYLLDYTNTDANFGTVEEFQEMVDTAHAHGIRVVLDVVMNHPGYATMYDMNEYSYGTLKSGWDSVYYDWANINDTYYSKIDYNSSTNDWSKWWGTDWIRAGIAGYTAGGSDDLTKGVDYLPDFRTESTTEVGIPELLKTKWTQEGTYETKSAYINDWFEQTGYAKTVTNYQVMFLSEWVRTFGIDGFRCDTAKHVDKESWSALKTECVKALNEWKSENPDKVLDDEDFWMTGENYGMALDPSSDYYTTGGFDSMINFENGGGLPTLDKLADKYQEYADTINTNDNFNVLTYISSHDDTMANSKSNADMYYQGTAFQLLPGAIQIYYGDESNREKLSNVKLEDGTRLSLADHGLRSFMNWDSIDTELSTHWQKVGQFRSNHVAVGAGANAVVDCSDANGVAFTRTYDKDGVEDAIAAVVASVANTDITVDVSSIFADGTKVVNAYDNSEAIVADGKVTFNSGAHNTILVEAYSEPAEEPTTPSENEEPNASTEAPTTVTTTTATTGTQASTSSSTNATTVATNATTATSTSDTTSGKVETGDSTTTAMLMMVLLAAGGTVVITRKKFRKN